MASQINAIGRSKLKFVKQIGSGGFGDVYQMIWKRKEGNIDIAAKKLHRNDKHELNIMSSLDHPNIVKLLGVVDEEVDFMLILELCEGGSLRSYLDKHQDKHLPTDEFFSWAKQAAIPVKYLREMKIVHKDIKSPNYMITRGNILKLGDFGLAKNIEITISKASESASYQWMAPELLKHGILSPSYDLFSLAVVLWELWTRKFPFQGVASPAVLWKVCNDDERPPIPEDCPQWLADLMRQCWNSDYHKRPSIDDIVDVIFKAAAAVAAAAAAAAKKSRQLQIINGLWKLEKEFTDCRPWVDRKLFADDAGMAVNQNGDVAITAPYKAKVNVFSTDGEHKFTMDTTQGLEPGTTSYPNQVIVNSNGDYFVTDTTNYIKIYDVNGVFKDKWESSNPQSASHYSSLKGLTIDSRGHILTGDSRNRCINIHRQDGTHITSIKVGIAPRYLGVTSQDTTIIVAECYNPPQIISDTGRVIYTLKHPVNDGKWMVYGVYCYKDMILISNKDQEILCFSVYGEYLGSIDLPEVDFLSRIWPITGLSLVNGKKLIVGQLGTVKVFARNS